MHGLDAGNFHSPRPFGSGKPGQRMKFWDNRPKFARRLEKTNGRK
jgi:hypothetical protein